MPKATTYHEEQKRLRHTRKPYHSSGHYDYVDQDDKDQHYDSDEDNIKGFRTSDLNELGDVLEEETEAPEHNIWNPDGYKNNCAYMGFANVTGKPLDEIEDDIGSPPLDADGLPDDKIERARERYGLRITPSPPPEEYFEEGGRASMLYRDGQVGHVVEWEHGDNERNMTFRDYQEYGHGQDVTDEVRGR
jgi:hypothetical protein